MALVRRCINVNVEGDSLVGLLLVGGALLQDFASLSNHVCVHNVQAC